MSSPAGTESLVLKFGGTSVQHAEAMNRVVRIVRDEGGKKPIVVTSACAGITNDLVECARLCGEADYDAALEVVERDWQTPLHRITRPNITRV